MFYSTVVVHYEIGYIFNKFQSQKLHEDHTLYFKEMYIINFHFFFTKNETKLKNMLFL